MSNQICYNRSIWLVDMNMQNLIEILIDDVDGYVLLMPTWGLFDMFKNEETRARDSRSPFMMALAPYRMVKKMFVGWLSEVVVWTKEYPYPMMLSGQDKDGLFHSVDLKPIVDREDLAKIIGIESADLDDFILFTNRENK